MTFTIYTQGSDEGITIIADGMDEAIDVAYEKLEIDPHLAELDCVADWLSYITVACSTTYQIVEEGHGRQPWE